MNSLLYHGSYLTVENPIADYGRDNLDFGKGFYLTDIKGQAENWARTVSSRRGRNAIPVLNIYEIDNASLQNYNALKFESYNIEWLEYVVSCRNGGNLWREYDYIEGGVANDNVIDTVEDYEKGIITAEQALGQLKYKKVNHQLCIVNQRILDNLLKFKLSIDLR